MLIFKNKECKKAILFVHVYTDCIPLVLAISLFLSTEAKQTFMYRKQDSPILKWCYTFTNSADKSIFLKGHRLKQIQPNESQLLNAIRRYRDVSDLNQWFPTSFLKTDCPACFRCFLALPPLLQGKVTVIQWAMICEVPEEDICCESALYTETELKWKLKQVNIWNREVQFWRVGKEMPI